MNCITHRWRFPGAVAILLALLPLVSGAQTIYRSVGPDGRITFSDRPPANKTDKATPLGPGGNSAAAANGTGNLPFELRQVMSRYPVTLYSGDGCEPCNAGRSMLNSRGIPYTERTVLSNEDIDAMQRLVGGSTVPTLTIGSQRLTGYSMSEWGSYLDAAGYPASSRLPPGYRNPPATPLAPPPAETERPAEPVAPPPPPPPPPSGPTPANPGGIVF